MFFRDRDQEDERIGAGLIAVVESLDSVRVLYRTIKILVIVNLAIWTLGIFFSDYLIELVDFFGRFGDKLKLAPFVLPFFTGMWLAYAIARLRSPDLEDRKLLESEFMGSVAYNSEANRRFITWIAAILAGVFNAILFMLAVNATSSGGLNLLG